MNEYFYKLHPCCCVPEHKHYSYFHYVKDVTVKMLVYLAINNKSKLDSRFIRDKKLFVEFVDALHKEKMRTDVNYISKYIVGMGYSRD